MRIPTTSTRSWSALVALAAIALALAACATNGGDPDPTPTTGSLVVVVGGLPTGADADVTVSGPDGFEQTVTGTTTLSDLEPGTYTAIAADVTVDGDVYAATVSGSPATVSAASSATITVTYTAPDPVITGTLQIDIGGLPAGADADVTVSGPDGFEQTVTGTTTLSDLEPGTYTAIAADVTVDDDVYAATVSGAPATVPADGTATITVTYTLLDPVIIGTLQVDIAGLPAGADADVTVSGPGLDTALTSSETFVAIPAGTYDVSAAAVTHEGIEYTATVDGSPATVEPDSVATVSVSYTATSTQPGSLTVTIEGLPEATDADVTVSGPDDVEQTITATATLSDLEPGTYTATAADVTVDTDVYAATVSGSPATVPADGTATITVTYTLLDPETVGTLQVDITGLPEGVDADVEVAGVGITQTLAASATLAGLTPGNYTVIASDIDVDGLTYGGIVSLSPALVLPEETTTVTVTYQGVAFPDGDAASNPGLHAQFRKTSGAPVWVDRMLFNAADPIDTKGIQLRNDVSNPGDPFDFLAFRLVHGQSPTTRVTMTLECGFEAEVGSVIRAVLTDSSGSTIGGTLTCGSTRDYSIPAVGGSGNYLVEIGSGSNNPFYTNYVLSINAYCFQDCNYTPYEE